MCDTVRHVRYVTVSFNSDGFPSDRNGGRFMRYREGLLRACGPQGLRQEQRASTSDVSHGGRSTFSPL